MLRNSFILLLTFYILACTASKKIGKSAKEKVLDNAALKTAHVGISIYNPESNKYLYNYQGDKYFVPASNTKIPTCYAAMKYLGDSLVGLRVGIPEGEWFKNRTVIIQATADPSFMHPDFKNQPVFDFLKLKIIGENRTPGIVYDSAMVERWGSGWSWNDYDASYMAERNSFPIFGNLIDLHLNDTGKRGNQNVIKFLRRMHTNPFFTQAPYFDSIVNKSSSLSSIESLDSMPKFSITRDIAKNEFSISPSRTRFVNRSIPFVTEGQETTIQILSDTFKKKFTAVYQQRTKNTYLWDNENGDITIVIIPEWKKIYSQPTDSLLKPMMHHSDNFFAEQSLLMVSNEFLGVMNDARIIDTLLKTDFKNLPQKPRWVDGSGLSRYNLFTPQDFVVILNKMKNEFGMKRIQEIFASGNEGTLTNYYLADSSFIYAKTGTLSGVVAISGFLYTKKQKLLIFSVLVNNHQASATQVRRAVESFIHGIRENY